MVPTTRPALICVHLCTYTKHGFPALLPASCILDQAECHVRACKQVEKRFPDKESKIVVGCSNGRQYTMDVLLALDEEGYTNLAGLKGGFYAWNAVFDGKLNRRRVGEYAETYNHDGDSAGIHSSGAGFPKMDPADKFVGQEY